MPKGMMNFLILIAIVLAIIYVVFKTPIGVMIGVLQTPYLSDGTKTADIDRPVSLPSQATT